MNAINTIKPVAVLWVGTMVAALSQFGVQWLLASRLGPAEFGSFSSALAVVTMLSPLAGFGVYRLLLRSFGEEGWAATRWLGAAVRFVLISTAMVMGLIIVLAWSGAVGRDQVAVVAILAPLVAGQATIELIASRCQLEERFVAISLWQLIQPLGRLLAVLAIAMVMGASFNASDAALCYSAVAILLALAGVQEIRSFWRGDFRLVGHGPVAASRFDGEAPGIARVAERSWPFGVDALFFLFYLQGGVFLLERMSSAWSAGIYNAALSFVMAAYLLPGVIYQKFLTARLHRWMHHDLERLKAVHKLGCRAMLAVGSLGAVCTWLFGSEAVVWVLGDQYRMVGGPLSILALCIPLRFVSSGYGALMVAGDLVTKKVIVLGVAALCCALCTAVLAGPLGAVGAAWASVLAEGTVLVGMMWFVRDAGILSGGKDCESDSRV